VSTRSDDALKALRRIQRMTELASRRLAQTAGLTPSQLSVLRILDEGGEISAGQIAKATQLKHATITSLIDKLEARGFVARQKWETDRRRVWLHLLPAGKVALSKAPNPLHETFRTGFDALPDWHQAMLVSALERAVLLLDAEKLDAAPFLDVGELDEKPT
jgi:DNA-binding MarR family transcriptional regulator